MKQSNKVKRLERRQSGYEQIMEDLKNDPVKAGGYKRPGSLKK